MAVIEVERLSKAYTATKKESGIAGAFKALLTRKVEHIHAVREVSFSLAEGEIVGFLGPNGAGKTTTIKMLSGILYPSGGSATVLGFTPFQRDPRMLRQMSLVMGNKMQLWWDLPARESFLVMKELYDVPDADYKKRLDFLADHLQIGAKLDTQVRKLSLGERMKCELVAALLHRPRVVFLDEPTIGLDVVSQKRIRDFLKVLNQEDGSTILLTSHYMQDVEALCERVIMINNGSMAFEGTLEALTAQMDPQKRLRITFKGEAPVDRFESVIETFDGGVVITAPRNETPALAASILSNYDVADIAIEDPPIEEIVTKLMESTG
ncbi:MAG: ATP-binding cassette domain-containing protein [Chthonomonas sp.]|nr:ATP-binding cassette domain-containing protein [Chthonomonas sp.]